jgi:hypothetical protein
MCPTWGGPLLIMRAPSGFCRGKVHDIELNQLSRQLPPFTGMPAQFSDESDVGGHIC